MTKEAKENKLSSYFSNSIIDVQRSAKSLSQKSTSISIKILINYLQMQGIIASFDLNWPSYIKNYLSGQSNVSFISADIFSLECLKESFLITNFHKNNN